nr:hypothetical protein [Micromonospora sp. DSM 115978]
MTRRRAGEVPIRPRLQLLAAAALVGVAVTVPCAALRLLGAADPGGAVVLAVDVSLLAVAAVAGFSASVRRQSERILV